MMRRLLIGLYSTILLAILAYGALVLYERWPKPEFRYPTTGEQ
jgi:hypothetical protein